MCDALFKIIQTQSEFLANGALAAIEFTDDESMIDPAYLSIFISPHSSSCWLHSSHSGLLPAARRHLACPTSKPLPGFPSPASPTTGSPSCLKPPLKCHLLREAFQTLLSPLCSSQPRVSFKERITGPSPTASLPNFKPHPNLSPPAQVLGTQPTNGQQTQEE